MRGLFRHQGEDKDLPRLIATVKNMSEREQSQLSKCLHRRYGDNGKNRRRMSCFVFDGHNNESENCRDFVLTLSNGTAFIETRTALLPGQTVTMLFPDTKNQGPVEIVGEVIWVDSKSQGT